MAGSPAWQEQDNCVRCCKLTLDGGGYFSKQLLLQETVNNGSFNNLDAFLANKKNKIIMHKTKKIIKDTQYSLMFPINGTPTNLEDWDITLVTLILTNYVTLNQGHKDAIQDVRRLRNNVHGHIVHLAMTETIFKTTWADISSTLTRISQLLTDQQCQTVIKDMIASIEHEVLSADKVMQTMKEWHESDKKVEEMLGELREEFTSVKQMVKNIEGKQQKDNTRIESQLTKVDDKIERSLIRSKFYHGDLRKGIGDQKQANSLIQNQLTSVEDKMESYYIGLKKNLGDVGNRLNLMESYISRLINQHNQSVDQMKLNRKLANAEVQIEAHMAELRKLDIGHKTRLTQIAVNLLQSNNIVVIQGKPGVGKTHNAWNVLKEMTDSVSNLKTLVFCDPSVNEVEEMIDTSNKYLLLFNDFLGRINIEKSKLSDWNRYITSLLPYIKCGKMFVVITIRTIIRNKCSNESVNTIFDKVWTLDLDEFTMNVEEKRNMLNNYSEHFDVDTSELDIDKVINEPVYGVGFPLLCRVMKGKNVLNLFTRPVEVLKEDILCMPEKDNASFVSLLMTMFYDKTFEPTLLGDHETKCFEQIKTYFGAKTLNQYMMRTAAHSLLQTYLRIKEDGCFTFVHDTILEATFKAAVAKLPDILIQYCPLKTIVTFSNALTEDGTNMTYRMKYKMLLERFKMNLDKLAPEIKIIAGLSLWKQSEFIKVAFQVISPEMWYQEDDSINSLIVYFAGYGYIDIIEEIDIEINEKQPLIKINNKKTQKEKAMQEACLRGKSEIIKYLLIHGTTITEESMFAAVKGGNVQVMEQLLDAGGNIRAQRNDTGENLLHEVCRHGNLSMAQYILGKCEKSLKLDLLASETINAKQTPILYATLYSTAEMLKLMVDSGSDVMNKDKDRQGCLHLAAYNASYKTTDLLQVFIYLVSKGLDPKVTDIDNKTALHIASLKGHLGVVEYLCNKYPSLFMMTDKSNFTAAHYAAAGGQLKCLVYLKEQGVDLLANDSLGQSVLHLASYNGHFEVVKYLCTTYTSLIKITNNDNCTAAHFAAEGGHLKCLIYLKKQGVDLLANDSLGKSVLHFASYNGHFEVVKYLCTTYTSLIKIKDNDNLTAAYFAAEGGHLKCLIYLIEQGVDPLAGISIGRTVLHLASYKGHLEVVKYLCTTYTSLIKITNKNNITAAHEAAAGGQLKCLVYLIEKGVDPLARISNGRTVLHIASYKGHFEVVKYLCTTYTSLIKITDNDNLTTAHCAAAKGQLDCLVYLIEQGVDPLARSSLGRTVLHLASCYGHFEVVKYLCTTYTSLIKITDNDNYTAARGAAAEGHLDCLVYLIEQGVDPLARSSGGKTVLHLASCYGHFEVVKYLCTTYTSLIKITDNENLTAAHVAAAGGHLNCLVYLIKQGVDPLPSSYQGKNILVSASDKGHFEILKYICSTYPSLIKITNSDNCTAAHSAAEGGHLKCLVYLMEQGVDPLARISTGETVLHLASYNGHFEVVKYLCTTYTSLIKITDNGMYTAAHDAAVRGQLKCLEYLIEKGVDPLARISTGKTVLHLASYDGHFEVVKYLCTTYTSLIKITDNDNYTAAHVAAAEGHLKCLIYLKKQGVDLLANDSLGKYVLHFASYNGHFEVVKYLCTTYTSLIKITDNDNYTAAHCAAVRGQLKCLVYLIEKGVDPLARISTGKTLLHLASYKGHFEVVKYLCTTYTSLIKITDNDNLTAAHDAAAEGHLDCLVYLIEKGVDPLARVFVGQTLLHIASYNGHFEVVKYLCTTYTSLIKITDDENLTAAHVAAAGGHLNCLVYLIKQGVYPVLSSYQGKNILVSASDKGGFEVLKYICSTYPSLIKITNSISCTAAHCAAVRGQLKCLVYLIEQGVDTLERISTGITVLHLASYKGHFEVVKYLCDKYPCLIEKANNDYNTAAHYAAMEGQLKCLVYLIEKGVDPLARISCGKTVLHLASYYGHFEVVKYLCDKYPCLIEKADNDNNTAAHYAAREGQLKCVIYLINQWGQFDSNNFRW